MAYQAITSTGVFPVINTETYSTFTIDDREIDVRNIIFLIEFLLRKQGYKENLLDMDYDDLVKLLERDEKIDQLNE